MVVIEDIKKIKRNLLLIQNGKGGKKLTKKETTKVLENAMAWCSLAESTLVELERKIKNLI